MSKEQHLDKCISSLGEEMLLSYDATEVNETVQDWFRQSYE